MSPTEPSADLRQFASFLRQMYVALLNEGFVEREAFAIVGYLIGQMIPKPGES